MTRDVQMIPKTKTPKKPPKRLKAKRGTTTAELKRKADALWGELIHTRDRCCRICGKADGKLDAHHIMVRSHAATRTDPDNGILACFRCHRYVCHGTDPLLAVWHYEAILGHDGYRALRDKAIAGVRADKAFYAVEVARLERYLETERASRG